MIGIYLPLGAANLAAWIWAWLAFADRPTLLGTALLAWVFGLRHAIDADHIAAIDNVVRKLVQAGGKPYKVGLYFSLGHSTVVVLATLALTAATSLLQRHFEQFREIGGTIGIGVSAFFLLLIGLVNLVLLRNTWRSFRRARRSGIVETEELDALLSGGGVLARLLKPVFRSVSQSWQMYPIGFLFGLGFDTATEIGLLSIAAAEAAKGLSAWQILVFPALFTAGMTLVDTTDSVLMVGIYRWAFVDPVRKLWYNLTITAASVVVALLIGTIEGLGLLADRFSLDGTFWAAVSGLNDDLANFGFVVIGIFAVSWAASMAIYRWRRFDTPAL